MAPKKKKFNDRTALLIHCSKQEAELIRRAAERQRRTISGFMLNAVMSRLELEERVEERRQHFRDVLDAKRAGTEK